MTSCLDTAELKRPHLHSGSPSDILISRIGRVKRPVTCYNFLAAPSSGLEVHSANQQPSFNKHCSSFAQKDMVVRGKIFTCRLLVMYTCK